MKKGKTESTYRFKCNNVKDENDFTLYKSSLKNIDGTNVFYSPEYINPSVGDNFIYFTFYKENKAVAILPIHLKRISNYCSTDIEYFDASSPYGYSGPLFNNLTKKEIQLFWQFVDNWYLENNIVTEFVRFSLNQNYNYYSGQLIPTLNNVKGNITNFDNLWTNFKQKVRNNYRKSCKYGLKAKIYEKNISTDIILEFHNIYINSLQRNKASTNYYYTKQYFENLINNNKSNTVLVLVYKDEIPVSAELILVDGKTLYSHLGGTNAEYFNMRPNDFLKIEVMKWAIENDKKYYILGGGRTNFDGLYQYKKAFFPKDEDVVFYTGRKVINNKAYDSIIKEITVSYEDVDNLIKSPKSFFPIYKK